MSNRDQYALISADHRLLDFLVVFEFLGKGDFR